MAGTFATTTKEYDDPALRLPIEVARKLMKVKGATSWVVLLDKTERTPDAVNYLGQQLPSAKFEVVPGRRWRISTTRRSFSFPNRSASSSSLSASSLS